ncbi:MAG: PHP domain-containing protein [Ignavibacteriaceae bacterium]|nr:PHP domain-containing protein [Ignavibacteriaceae bacterium]
MESKVDLHIHTFHSDGFFSPEEVVSKAKEKRLDGISITDHDSINSLNEAVEAGKQYGVEVIPGVEISTDISDREIHILGYFIDPENIELEHYLRFFREERLKRASRIVKKLNTLGLEITLDDVIQKARKGAIGRPHIAHAMKERGLVSNYFEAFNKYIGNGCPAYERKVHVSPQSAFKIISDAGGLSFIAHPGNLPEYIIKELIDAGVDGIEVIHPSHHPHKVKYYRGIVNEYFLLESGGSDFHGGDRNDEENFGKFYTDTSIVEAMRTRLIKNSA